MRTLFSISLIILAHIPLLGQIAVEPYFTYVHPGEKLEKANFKSGFGGGISVMFPIMSELERPYELFLGGNLDYSWHGRQDDAIPFDSEQAVIYVRNAAWGLHGTARAILGPSHFPIRPMVEGFVGTRLFRSTERISWDDYDIEDEIDGIVNDFVLSYGGGLGLGIRFPGNVLLSLKIQAIFGGFAEYVDLETVEETGVDEYTFETRVSQTQQYALKLGLIFPVE